MQQILPYSGGDLGGKLVGVLLLQPVPPKNFYFLCFAPLTGSKNFGMPCFADGARQKFKSEYPSEIYCTKIFLSLSRASRK